MDIVNNAKMTDTGVNDGISPAIVRAEVMLDRVHASPGVQGHNKEKLTQQSRRFGLHRLNQTDLWPARHTRSL